MSEHQQEVIDRLEKIERGLGVRGSLRSRMFSALEKLAVPIFLGVLAFIVTYASNKIADEQTNVAKEGLALQKWQAEETIDAKYAEIYFNMLADENPLVCRQALNVLSALSKGRAIVFAGIAQEQQPCGKAVGEEAKQLKVKLSNEFKVSSGRDRVESILDDIDALSDDDAKALAAYPPVQDDQVDELLAARDSEGEKLWLTVGPVARQALRMRVSFASVDDLITWERVIKAKAAGPGSAVVTTEEQFDKSVSPEAVEKEKELRLSSGAITSQIRDERYRWVLVTEWPVQ